MSWRRCLRGDARVAAPNARWSARRESGASRLRRFAALPGALCPAWRRAAAWPPGRGCGRGARPAALSARRPVPRPQLRCCFAPPRRARRAAGRRGRLRRAPPRLWRRRQRFRRPLCRTSTAQRWSRDCAASRRTPWRCSRCSWAPTRHSTPVRPSRRELPPSGAVTAPWRRHHTSLAPARTRFCCKGAAPALTRARTHRSGVRRPRRRRGGSVSDARAARRAAARGRKGA